MKFKKIIKIDSAPVLIKISDVEVYIPEDSFSRHILHGSSDPGNYNDLAKVEPDGRRDPGDHPGAPHACFVKEIYEKTQNN